MSPVSDRTTFARDRQCPLYPLYQQALTDSSFQHLTGRMQGHRQVTDPYLLTLARCEGLELVTLDRHLVALAGDGASAVRLAPPE